ncbi:unnamed protein product [Calypogeia fissa]
MTIIQICLLLVLLHGNPVTAKTTVFHSNCTRPPPGSYFNFVAAPNSRGTLQILWSCLFTLFTCIWTVQHLDIPPEDLHPYGEATTKPIYSIMTLLMPEYLVGLALEEFLNARKSVKKMRAQFPKIIWTPMHAFYAEMGGYILMEQEIASTTKNDEEASPSPTNNTTTTIPTIKIDEEMGECILTEETASTSKNNEEMGRELWTEQEVASTTKNHEEGSPTPTNSTTTTTPMTKNNEKMEGCILMEQEIASTTMICEEALPPTSGRIAAPAHIVLNTKKIMMCLQFGILPSQPKFLSERDIKRRAKGDIFLKCIVAIQVSWFMVQGSHFT